jgi:hypothetical protein
MTRQNFLARAITVLALVFTSSLAQQPAPVQLKFSELYGKVTIRGMEFSPKLLEAGGKRVEILGYMAPPLKPRIEFFVLTKTPMSTCPFCSTAADDLRAEKQSTRQYGWTDSCAWQTRVGRKRRSEHRFRVVDPRLCR